MDMFRSVFKSSFKTCIFHHYFPAFSWLIVSLGLVTAVVLRLQQLVPNSTWCQIQKKLGARRQDLIYILITNDFR